MAEWLMAEWLEQASQWHEMYCHDLEVMSSNPGWVELVSVQYFLKSLMAKWLEQASQWHEMYCHDLKVMSSNPDWVELGVRTCSTSVLSRTSTKHILIASQTAQVA